MYLEQNGGSSQSKDQRTTERRDKSKGFFLEKEQVIPNTTRGILW